MKRLISLLLCLILCAACLSVLAETPEVVKIKVVTPPDKTHYIQGEPFDPVGMTVNAVLSDDTVVENVPCQFEVGNIVTCSYGGKTTIQIVFYTLLGNTGPYSVAATPALSDSPLAGKTYVFLGSSVTYGASSEGESMADFLAARHGAVCVKEAVSGTTLASPQEPGQELCEAL